MIVAQFIVLKYEDPDSAFLSEVNLSLENQMGTHLFLKWLHDEISRQQPVEQV